MISLRERYGNCRIGNLSIILVLIVSRPNSITPLRKYYKIYVSIEPSSLERKRAHYSFNIGKFNTYVRVNSSQRPSCSTHCKQSGYMGQMKILTIYTFAIHSTILSYRRFPNERVIHSANRIQRAVI